MLQIKTCPVCNATGFKNDLTCKDYTVSQETFQLVTCNSCSFKFTNPRPEDSVLGNYYKSEDYISHSNTKKGIVSRLYHVVRNYTLGKKLGLVKKYVSRGTILDYGCGTGMFLSVCKKDQWKSYGIEPDLGARNIAKQMGSSIFESKENLVLENSNIKFNTITLWHVLEHVTDLDTTLRFFYERLDQNGILIIAVPNYTSFDANHYKEFWAAYDVPRHLYHFEVATVSKLLMRFGFTLVETRPMKFDSFYVSMLSEKYKTGSINYLKAFWTGLSSNLNSKKPTDYSSVIYVFKKA